MKEHSSAYLCNDINELKRFGTFIGSTHLTQLKDTYWNIPEVERAPQWTPIPVIEPGRIEYAKKKS